MPLTPADLPPAIAAAHGIAQPKANKFHAKGRKVDGIWFDSGVEADRWGELVLMQKAGLISNLHAHPKFELMVRGQKIGTFTPDSAYIEHGQIVAEDVKGGKATVTKDYRLRVKLFRVLFPAYAFREVRR